MPSPAVSILRRFESHGFELWLVPALAAAAGWATLASAGADVAMLRGIVFLGGPLLLLTGLHMRLDGYLHAPARLRLLPLPLPPARHWATASGPHRRGLAWTGGLGSAAIAGAALGAGLSGPVALGLWGDFAVLWTVAVLLEPIIPAAGAWLGRRFDEDQPQRRWQLTLGGGWTLPEAVVHLYAPALGVAACALFAMPGQLWIDRGVDGLPSPSALGWVAIAAGLTAAALGRLARYGYARGLFGAVPWVHEATRTLAGPPVPERVPRWLLGGHDPMRRLLVRQFWRTTPVPGLRLAALWIGAGWMALAAPPSVPAAATVLALAATWLVPGARVAILRPQRARLAAAWPLPPAARAGRSWTAWVVLTAPAVVAVVAVGTTWALGGDS